MLESYRSLISALACVSSACMVLAWSADASAQSGNVECKSTETQAECHARLNCRPDEDLEECQERLREGTGGDDRGDRDRDDRGDRDRGDRGDRDRGDRGDRDRSGRDRGDRSDRDRSGRDRSDRGDRDRSGRDRGGRNGGDRSRRGGDRGRGDRGDSGGDGLRGFQANKTFGFGLELAAPTGFNGKYFLSEDGALDFGLGWIYRHYYYGEGLHLYLDYLWHPVSLASTPTLELPLYVGVGGRFWDFEFCNRDACYHGSAFGVRVPVGISFDFNNVPLDIFLQLVPVIDIITDDYYYRYNDRAHFGIDGSVGIRYWFK